MKVARNQLSIAKLHATAPDRRYWLGLSASERLRVVQINRQVAYGRANGARRLQRILEVAERN